jgi:hypothetical protein
MLPELEVFVSKFYDFQLTLDEEVSVQVFQATVEQLDRQQLLESLVHLYAFKTFCDRNYRELLKKEWGLEVNHE